MIGSYVNDNLGPLWGGIGTFPGIGSTRPRTPRPSETWSTEALEISFAFLPFSNLSLGTLATPRQQCVPQCGMPTYLT
jgi:hypothetical protein